MTRVLLSCALLICAGAAAGSPLRAQDVIQPGKPTTARMYILNHDRSEAIPVIVEGMAQVLPAEIQTIAPGVTVGTRAVRQAWEYRQLTVTAGQDAVPMLNALGTEGWEAVGAQPGGANGSTIWTLKRVR